MRYDAEHKQRTRDKVVHEAAKAIRQHGPDKIGVAALMSQAGLTHGGFYAHFKSKDDLIAEAVTHMFESRMETLARNLATEDPAEGVARYVDVYLSQLHREHRDKGCAVASLSGDVARMPAKARKRFEAGVESLVQLLSKSLAAMGLDDSEGLSRSVYAEMAGALAMSRAVHDSEKGQQILQASRKQVYLRLGLGTPK